MRQFEFKNFLKPGRKSRESDTSTESTASTAPEPDHAADSTTSSELGHECEDLHDDALPETSDTDDSPASSEVERECEELRDALRKTERLRRTKDACLRLICDEMTELSRWTAELVPLEDGEDRESSLSGRIEALRDEIRDCTTINSDSLSSWQTPTGFYGSLNDVSVMEVLDFVRLTKKTGTLRVVSDAFEGSLTVLEGQALRAEAGALTEFEAFCELIRAEIGHLEFRAGEVDIQARNLDRGTMQLMMKALQVLDEQSTQRRR